MLHTLYGQAMKHNTQFFVEYFALDLLMDNEGKIFCTARSIRSIRGACLEGPVSCFILNFPAYVLLTPLLLCWPVSITMLFSRTLVCL